MAVVNGILYAIIRSSVQKRVVECCQVRCPPAVEFISAVGAAAAACMVSIKMW